MTRAGAPTCRPRVMTQMASTRPAEAQASSGLWSAPEADLLRTLGCQAEGLSTTEAHRRLHQAHQRAPHHHRTPLVLVLRQFANPITLILVAATVVSAALGEQTDA